MSTLIKNVSMTKAQQVRAFEVVGSYIKLDDRSETIVDSYDKPTKQVIVKVMTRGLTYFVIIGARGRVINHGWI